jgi:hypothetical protein
MAVQRNVSIVINGNLPTSGFRALIKRIEEIENKIANGETVAAIDSASDPAMRIVVTGMTFSEVYAFDISDLDPSTGAYVVDLVSIGI